MAKGLHRGVGRSNVQVLVMTPKGRILHAVSGYVSPKDLHWELEQAVATWQAMQKADEKVQGAAKKVVQARQKKVMSLYDKTHGVTGRGSWARKIVASDRAFVLDHPLLPVGAFRTRMLTGGPGTHFGYTSEEANDLTKPPPSGRPTEAQKRLIERRKALQGKAKARSAPPLRDS